MDISLQNVHSNKLLPKWEFFLYSFIAVFGVFFGLLFSTYYFFISYNLINTVISFGSIVLGMIFLVYVEKKIKEWEKGKKRH